MMDLPKKVYSGGHGKCHVQGIAVDTKREYMYFSFTTMLLKTDMQGNIVGSVEGLTGHLGCLDFNDDDGRVYGSLEYKQDSIGRGILNAIGVEEDEEDAFYVAIFDVSKIDRMGMDAERDGIMTTVYLKEVVDDYSGTSQDGKLHRYGCSGIDGISFGPDFGDHKGEKKYLKVAYGIYGDTERDDNDHQVILSYDISEWSKYETALSRKKSHKNGPEGVHRKYFVYTGNTTYGVQNLEYDGNTGNWLMAVYEGEKNKYPNLPMYIIDGSAKPELKEIEGRNELTVPLLKDGVYDEKSGIYGWTFEYGQTGLFSLDNGYFYISHNGVNDDGEQDSTVYLYKWNGKTPDPFEFA